MLPNALLCGVSYELFWHLNPTKLKPFYKAFELKRKLEDEQAWMYWGNYGFSALETVFAHFGAGLAGKSSQAKYIEKPRLAEIIENQNLTQEEIDEKELQKMLFAEKQWQMVANMKNLPQTEIK